MYYVICKEIRKAAHVRGILLVNDKGEKDEKLCYRAMSDGHAFLPDIFPDAYSEIILSLGTRFSFYKNIHSIGISRLIFGQNINPLGRRLTVLNESSHHGRLFTAIS